MPWVRPICLQPRISIPASMIKAVYDAEESRQCAGAAAGEAVEIKMGDKPLIEIEVLFRQTGDERSGEPCDLSIELVLYTNVNRKGRPTCRMLDTLRLDDALVLSAWLLKHTDRLIKETEDWAFPKPMEKP